MAQITGSGAAFLDYDNDGDLDIYLVNGRGIDSASGRPSSNRLYRQEGNGTFVDVTDGSGLADEGFGMGVAVGDIDNDGYVDVYVTNVGPDALYRNSGDGTFDNITRVAGILNSNWGSSVAFLDFDRDGFLDIYVTNYLVYESAVVCTDEAGRRDFCGPQVFSPVPDILYRNEGDGSFSDVSEISGIGRAGSRGLGVAVGDFNGDGYSDVYVANDGEANFLWINRRDGTFEEQALVLGAAVNMLGRPEAGMGVALNDLDDDDDLDIFITHLRGESNTLYRGIGGMYEDDAFGSRLGGSSVSYTGFGTGFFDFDNDGDLDLVVANGRVIRGPVLLPDAVGTFWDAYAEPNLLYRNEGQGVFTDVSDHASDFTGMMENSRGLVFGDIDNDGDIDLLVTNGGGRARLYRNDNEGGHWLMVRAWDPDLGRDAVGAGVTVVAGERRINRFVAPAYSFLSSNDPRVHFGLGSLSRIDQIVVHWPDGDVEEFGGTEIDVMITVRKGEGTSVDG